MILKGIKVATVLGILEGIESKLSSHNCPNCQEWLALAITPSTALAIIDSREEEVMLWRGNTG